MESIQKCDRLSRWSELNTYVRVLGYFTMRVCDEYLLDLAHFYVALLYLVLGGFAAVE